MTKFHVIIPARYASTRLPGKPLRKIGNRAMVLHVCDRAKESGALSVTVATDNQQILEITQAAGYNAVMTSDDHQSGSDRICEAAHLLNIKNDSILINVQGDEPFIPAENIQQVASLLHNSKAGMSTLCCPIHDADELLNPNAVKVIFNHQHEAIYFSRSVIPYNREKPVKSDQKLDTEYFRHIGIYGYRFDFLEQFVKLNPSRLERVESLEQLRAIENGFKIMIAPVTKAPPPGVDTENDLSLANEHWDKHFA